MICCINIKNMALISEAQIDFDDGFNVITGETGAGKSVLIGSINMLLGERMSKDIISSDEKKAAVSALFYINDDKEREVLKKNGAETDEAGELLMSREIYDDGRNVCKINGNLVNVGKLKQIGKILVDLHGQHNNQTLLTPSQHIDILDRFAGDILLSELDSYKELYSEMTELKKKLEALSETVSERERRIDILNFEINEIKSVAPSIGEDEELKKRKTIADNKKKLLSLAGGALYALYESTENENAYQLVAAAADSLYDAANFDSDLKTVYESINNALINIQESAAEIRGYIDRFETGSDAVFDIDARLDELYKIKRKYGGSIEKALEYLKEKEEELLNINTSEQQIAETEKKLDDILNKLNQKAEKISALRKKTAAVMAKKITESMHFLNMTDAVFDVSLKKKDLSSNGTDDVEFMLTTIKGEAPKPLAKIASGGELSRIMLAIKSELADVDDIHTLIFDEIDSGVSGRAAQRIGEKMKQLSLHKQILCVTHLAQIAALSDKHLLIEKTEEGAVTKAKVKALDTEGRKKELARIISGDKITETTLKQAEEMIN